MVERFYSRISMKKNCLFILPVQLKASGAWNLKNSFILTDHWIKNVTMVSNTDPALTVWPRTIIMKNLNFVCVMTVTAMSASSAFQRKLHCAKNWQTQLCENMWKTYKRYDWLAHSKFSETNLTTVYVLVGFLSILELACFSFVFLFRPRKKYSIARRLPKRVILLRSVTFLTNIAQNCLHGTQKQLGFTVHSSNDCLKLNQIIAKRHEAYIYITEQGVSVFPRIRWYLPIP